MSQSASIAPCNKHTLQPCYYMLHYYANLIIP